MHNLHQNYKKKTSELTITRIYFRNSNLANYKIAMYFCVPKANNPQVKLTLVNLDKIFPTKIKLLNLFAMI